MARLRISAGLLMYRRVAGKLEVLLAHPGGPYFRRKDEGAWTIPKGVMESGEELLETAQREFREETGITPSGDYLALTPIKQRGGKTVHAWAFEGTCDPSEIRSNTFSMEWPPRSGQQQTFPEVDRADFFDLDSARRKVNPAQVDFLDELEALLGEKE